MKTLKLIFAVGAVALLFSQCRYDFIFQEEKKDPNDPNAPEVSFSNEIEPIFQGKCIACHFTGGRAPNLTTGNAYSSLVPNYVNTGNPEGSKIYTQATSGSSHPQYTTSEADLVLTWITQGAQDN